MTSGELLGGWPQTHRIQNWRLVSVWTMDSRFTPILNSVRLSLPHRTIWRRDRCDFSGTRPPPGQTTPVAIRSPGSQAPKSSRGMDRIGSTGRAQTYRIQNWRLVRLWAMDDFLTPILNSVRLSRSVGIAVGANSSGCVPARGSYNDILPVDCPRCDSVPWRIRRRSAAMD
jgi:hypothetical protein